jgi:hypothetical protein
MYLFTEKPIRKAKASGGYFLVLDKQSEEDRKIVIIHETLDRLYIDYEKDPDAISKDKKDDTIWRKYRLPFEKACFFVLVLGSKPGDEGDGFLENTTEETADDLWKS